MDDILHTPMCMTGDEEPQNSKPVARIAIALYGLFRHDCGSYNFEGVFMEPLKKSSKYTYIVDVILHANIAEHEDGARSQIRNHQTRHDIHVPSLTFLKFKPCKFDITDQDLVDADIEPTLNKTCYKYGDYWDYNFDCKTTKNYFRALYSQNDAANLIRAHEEKSGITYDVVVVVRPDVMFTRKMRAEDLDAIVHNGRKEDPTQLLMLPEWASFGGLNDRFMVGHRGPVLAAMRRFNDVDKYVNVVLEGGKIHSETYMKWTVEEYFNELEKVGGKGKIIQNGHFHFRRVRSDGFLVPSQYGGIKLGIGNWKECDVKKLAKMFPVTTTVTTRGKKSDLGETAVKAVPRTERIYSALATLVNQFIVVFGGSA